ncbi:MAG: DUF3244 domain-containing protein [Bacteroidales bacterium]|nr:DUF3244 domain-containing protein [Bacteroidales bacterium]
MKTTLSLLLTASFAVLMSLGLSAKTDGDLPIPIKISRPGANENRSPEQVPFYAQIEDYYVTLGCASSIGSAYITLISTAGDDYQTVFDTSAGEINIPISGASGQYRLDIVLFSGESYYGEFIL